jgi:hypothetical protein
MRALTITRFTNMRRIVLRRIVTQPFTVKIGLEPNACTLSLGVTNIHLDFAPLKIMSNSDAYSSHIVNSLRKLLGVGLTALGHRHRPMT